MPSETPVLDVLTAEFIGALRAALPADWDIVDAESKTDRPLGVVLYYEQGDILTTINNGPIPHGRLGVEYTLTLAAPEVEPVEGTPRVTAAILDLLPVLDASDQVAWDRAEKVRLTTGETCYRLEVVHLAQYPTNLDPATEPDQPEEA